MVQNAIYESTANLLIVQSMLNYLNPGYLDYRLPMAQRCKGRWKINEETVIIHEK
jgi:hypothetical protein